MYKYTYVYTCVCMHIYEKDLGHFEIRIYCALSVYNCRMPLILVHQCKQKAKSHVAFSFNNRKLVCLEKILYSEPKTLPRPKSVVISGFSVIAKSISGPFLSVTGTTSGVKQLLVSRERTLEFPALLLCRFKC